MLAVLFITMISCKEEEEIVTNKYYANAPKILAKAEEAAKTQCIF